MELVYFRESQGQPQADNLGMAMVSDTFVLEHKSGVHQPPKIRKIIGGPQGQN